MMKNINYLDHPYWIPKCLNIGQISIPLQIFSIYIFPPNLYSNRLHDWKCKNSHWPPYYFGILTISESFDTLAFVRILWCSCRVLNGVYIHKSDSNEGSNFIAIGIINIQNSAIEKFFPHCHNVILIVHITIGTALISISWLRWKHEFPTEWWIHILEFVLLTLQLMNQKWQCSQNFDLNSTCDTRTANNYEKHPLQNCYKINTAVKVMQNF